MKLADTPDLGSGTVRCGGSSPLLGILSPLFFFSPLQFPLNSIPANKFLWRKDPECKLAGRITALFVVLYREPAPGLAASDAKKPCDSWHFSREIYLAGTLFSESNQQIIYCIFHTFGCNCIQIHVSWSRN